MLQQRALSDRKAALRNERDIATYETHRAE